ncbi:ribonuclease H-like domain-containing protein [Tanacetum coccineum]
MISLKLSWIGHSYCQEFWYVVSWKSKKHNTFSKSSTEVEYRALTSVTSEATYVEEILERAHMLNSNSCRTPVDNESILGRDGDPVTDLTLYHSLADALLCGLGWLSSDSLIHFWIFLGDNLLSWSAKRQGTLSQSSMKAEYMGVANVVAEIAWVRNLLRELHAPVFTSTLVYCDNDKFVFFMSLPGFSMVISLPKGYPLHCLLSFTPA